MLERLRGKGTRVMLALLLAQMVVVSMLALSLSGLLRETDPAGDYHPGITVAGIPFDGLTEKEAQERIQKLVDRISRQPLLFTVDHETYRADKAGLNVAYNVPETLAEAKRVSQELTGVFGLWKKWRGTAPSPDIGLHVTFGREDVRTFLMETEKSVNRVPQSARLAITGTTAVVVPEVDGRRLQIEKTINVLERELQYFQKGLRVPLTVDVEKPEIVRADLEGSTQLLAEQRLPVSVTGGRLENAGRAAGLINGTVIKPQEIFSFNKRTAPFDATRQYVPVKAPEDIVEDGVGGGASQVASALYETALRGRVSVVERHAHLHQVDYAKPGLDAYVNGKEADLRLVNRGERPLYVQAVIENNQLHIALFGKMPIGGSASLSVSESKGSSLDTVIRADDQLLPSEERIIRQGKAGIRVQVKAAWRNASGTVVTENVSDDYYMPVVNLITSGARKEGEENTVSNTGEPSNPSNGQQPASSEDKPVQGEETSEDGKVKVDGDVIYIK